MVFDGYQQAGVNQPVGKQKRAMSLSDIALFLSVEWRLVDWRLVVMTANAVGVAVGNLFVAGGANVENFHFKSDRFTGKWVVGVDINVFQPDLNYYRLVGAMLCVYLHDLPRCDFAFG